MFGLSGLTWGSFLTCNGIGGGIGADCFGAAQPAVRYDSPTWGGFRFETSYGKNQFSASQSGIFFNPVNGAFFEVNTSDVDFWDIALFYTGDWNSIKLSAAAAYTWIETGVVTVGGANCVITICSPGDSVDLFQVGASIMHKPSGLGIYGLYQTEEGGGNIFNTVPVGPDFFSIPDTDVWYVKPFWRKAWSPIGATVLYGEYGQYNDMYGGLVGVLMNTFVGPNSGCITAVAVPAACFVTGSEVERWGVGLVQEIDSAAMHLWVRWQHQELDVDLAGFDLVTGDPVRVHQDFDDWDLFQAGGVIFF